mgnify:CR=1 FL=1
MEKEEIIEHFTSSCKDNMGGIYDVIRDCGFVLLKNDNKNSPKMTVFYQNGIRHKIIAVSSYLPYEINILLLEYMVTYYLKHQDSDIYMTIDEHYDFEEETAKVVDEINERLDNKVGKLLTQSCKYM